MSHLKVRIAAPETLFSPTPRETAMQGIGGGRWLYIVYNRGACQSQNLAVRPIPFQVSSNVCGTNAGTLRRPLLSPALYQFL